MLNPLKLCLMRRGGSGPIRKRSRLLSLTGVGAAVTVALSGFSAAPVANAYVPIWDVPPTIQVVNPDLTQKLDGNGKPQTTPQVGTILLANPGSLFSPRGTTFTYVWQRSTDGGTTWTPITGNAGNKRDYVPITTYLGQTIGVQVTARNSLWAPDATSVVAPIVKLANPVVGINPALVAPATALNNQPVANGGLPPFEAEVWFTWYGYPDNTPPSAAIAAGNNQAAPLNGNITFPNNAVNRGIHTAAAGTGTYEDPISFATSSSELAYGTEIYVPRFKKYFIGEDSCTECGQDMAGTGSYTDADGNAMLGSGPDGGPGMIHFDLWIGGQQDDWADVIKCENALTLGDDNGNPLMEKFVINPRPDMEVNPDPIFDPATGLCNEQRDADGNIVSSTPLDTGDSVGQWTSVSPLPEDGASGSITGVTPAPTAPAGSGNCITDPGNSAVPGTQLTMEPCVEGAANQNLTFSGAWIIMNNLCLDMGDGKGGSAAGVTGNNPRPVTLQKCNLNARQQWEQNADGTVDDIQSSNWALSDYGTGKLMATRNTPNQWSYWTFPGIADANGDLVKQATAPVSVSDADSSSAIGDGDSVLLGQQLAIEGSGITTPTADIRLRPTDADADSVLLATVNAGAQGGTAPGDPDLDGTFSTTVTIPADLDPGDYVLEVNGSTEVIPVGTSLTAQSELQYGTWPLNFRTVNRTAPISSAGTALTVAAPPVVPATPVITGAAVVGGSLSVSPGDWGPSGLVSLTYQWLSDGNPVAGETSDSYVPRTGDADHDVSVTVTGSYRDTSVSVTSTAVTVAAASFVDTPTPTVSGTWFYAKTLTADAGTWTPDPDSLAFQWLRDGSPISGATSASYKLGAADVGHQVSVQVTATKAGYGTVQTFSAAKTVDGKKFTKTGSASLSGKAKVGKSLKAKLGKFSPKPTKVSYQWLKNGAPISGATKSTYKLTKSVKGTKISVRITATKAGYYPVVKTSKAKKIK